MTHSILDNTTTAFDMEDTSDNGGTWTAQGSASALGQNVDIFKVGSAGISAKLDGGASGAQGGMQITRGTALDMDDGGTRRGMVAVWVLTTSVLGSGGIRIIGGTDASNNHEWICATPDGSTGILYAGGWARLVLDLTQTPDVTNGTMGATEWAAMDYWAIEFDVSTDIMGNIQTIYIDQMDVLTAADIAAGTRAFEVRGTTVTAGNALSELAGLSTVTDLGAIVEEPNGSFSLNMPVKMGDTTASATSTITSTNEYMFIPNHRFSAGFCIIEFDGGTGTNTATWGAEVGSGDNTVGSTGGAIRGIQDGTNGNFQILCDASDATTNLFGVVIDGADSVSLSQTNVKCVSVTFANCGSISLDVGAGATTWTVGEEIVSDGAGTVADPIAVGIVVGADTGATGNVQYVLKSTATNFVNDDVVTSQSTNVNKTVNGAPTTVVAGYSDKIGFGSVDSNFTGGTTTGTYQIGEGVTQTGTSATGWILEDDTTANTLYIDEDPGSPAWNGTGLITGDLSGATYTPTTRTADTVAPKDIGDEVDNDYSTIFGLDKTASGSGRTIQEFYEYTKYLTSKEADSTFQLQAGRNQLTDVEGRLYRKVDQSDATPTFAEQVDAPYGIKAGALFLGARSVFVQDMANADIQNYNLVDDAGTAEVPPNNQVLEVTGLAVGDKVVVYETTAPASTTIKTGQYQVGVVGGADNGATDSIVKVQDGTDDGTPLLADTPSSGTIRVEDPNNVGLFLNITYGSRSKADSEFTLDTTADQPTPDIGDVTSETDLVQGDDVYVTLLSVVADTATESKTIEYVGDLDIMTRVRKRGILPFEVTGTFSSTGASVAAIRTTDPVVDPV